MPDFGDSSVVGPNGALAAGTSLRETAKWLTVSLAAVGGAVVAGTPLSGFGSLPAGSSRVQFAVAGGVGAAIGVLLILIGAVITAAAPRLGLIEILDRQTCRWLKLSRQSLETMDIGDDLSGFISRYRAALTTRRDSYDLFRSDPSEATLREAQLTDSHAAYLSGIAQNLQDVANYRFLAHRWRRSVALMGLGGLLAAGGTVAFTWAANPPQSARASNALSAVIGAPQPGAVTLTDTGRAALQSAMSATCNLNGPLAASMLGESSGMPDLLIQQNGCSAVRVVVSPDWGMFTPSARVG